MLSLNEAGIKRRKRSLAVSGGPADDAPSEDAIQDSRGDGISPHQPRAA